jgi:hypothetical protein
MGLLNRRREPEVIIDLREPKSAHASARQWGSPVPCPECSGRGYLDHIDPFKEVMYLHCTQCTARYEVAKAELDRTNA